MPPVVETTEHIESNLTAWADLFLQWKHHLFSSRNLNQLLTVVGNMEGAFKLEQIPLNVRLDFLTKIIATVTEALEIVLEKLPGPGDKRYVELNSLWLKIEACRKLGLIDDETYAKIPQPVSA